MMLSGSSCLCTQGCQGSNRDQMPARLVPSPLRYRSDPTYTFFNLTLTLRHTGGSHLNVV